MLLKLEEYNSALIVQEYYKYTKRTLLYASFKFSTQHFITQYVPLLT